MRGVILFGLVVATVAASEFVEIKSGYHENVGIPLFERIKAYEESLPTAAYTDDRIVGGAIAPVGAHPYFAGLLINMVNLAGQSVCGSTLLSASRLVTAAHCWFDGVNQAWLYTVVLGSNRLLTGGTRIATNQVVMHPQWNPPSVHNDIAMIYLPTNVLFSATISPIDIPNVSEQWNTFEGWWAVAAGFGRTSDQQIGASLDVSHVALQVISVEACQRTYGNAIADSTLCTNGFGGMGVCHGDSGGPLVLHNNGRLVLIGVSSFASEFGCQFGHPSGFARVTSFRNFIIQHMV